MLWWECLLPSAWLVTENSQSDCYKSTFYICYIIVFYWLNTRWGIGTWILAVPLSPTNCKNLGYPLISWFITSLSVTQRNCLMSLSALNFPESMTHFEGSYFCLLLTSKKHLCYKGIVDPFSSYSCVGNTFYLDFLFFPTLLHSVVQTCMLPHLCAHPPAMETL